MLRNKIRDNIFRYISQANYLLAVFSGILMVLLALSTSYGVARRYVFNSPEIYSYEIGCMLLLASFILATASVEWSDRFMRVDIVLAHLHQKAYSIIKDIISPFIGLALVILLTWQSGIDAVYSFQIGLKQI